MNANRSDVFTHFHGGSGILVTGLASFQRIAAPTPRTPRWLRQSRIVVPSSDVISETSEIL